MSEYLFLMWLCLKLFTGHLNGELVFRGILFCKTPLTLLTKRSIIIVQLTDTPALQPLISLRAGGFFYLLIFCRFVIFTCLFLTSLIKKSIIKITISFYTSPCFLTHLPLKGNRGFVLKMGDKRMKQCSIVLKKCKSLRKSFIYNVLLRL